jgi:hypothetical protein
MKYAVKHMYGISANHYTSSLSEPLFGTGQGSGASPAIWLSLVVILLNSLDRMSKEDNIPALSFSDPWKEILAEWRVGAFVDDTNQGVVDPTGDLSAEDLVEQLRQAGQMWERLLHISGGSLNLSKCSWTMQYWMWKNGRPCLQPLSSNDPLLIMTSGTSPDHHVIKRHTNVIELKGLGVHMNFMGTFQFHSSNMRQKFDGLARRLRQSRLSPGLSRAFYTSFYLPAVKYSLPVTSMSDLDLQKIQSKMTASALNALGYNQHYPHDVAFASQHSFGCGLIDLRIEQGLMQLQSLLDFVGTSHKVGNVILISLRHLQLEAGVSFDLFHLPHRQLPYLTDCWLLHLRRFCSKFGISLRIRSNRVPQSARENDSFLMEHALKLNLTRRELTDINLVRTHLQVTTVSDIASACGTQIHQLSWRCKPIPDRKSRFTFARQPNISSGQRGLWRKLMRSLLGNLTSPDLLSLQLPLGGWHADSNMIWSAMTWDSNLYRRDPYHSTGERDVAVHFPQQFVGPNGIPGSGIFYDSTPDWYSATVPRLATPTDITGCHIFRATSAAVSFPLQEKPAKSFKASLKHLPPAEQRLLSNVSFDTCDAEKTLLQYLQLECTLYIGANGQTQHHCGSFSWIICAPGKDQLILNTGPVDGWHKCQSSLRSAVTALASVTLYLDELVLFHSVTIRCTFQLYVNNSRALRHVSNIRDKTPTRKFVDHADALSILQAAPEVISHFLLNHVKGNHDNDTEFDKLPFGIQLHVLCERLTTRQLQHHGAQDSERTQTCALRPRHLPVEVFLGTQNISSQYILHLREELRSRRHREFLQKKYKWTSETVAEVAWDALSLCGHRVRADNASTRSKLVHNWLNLGVQRAKLGNARTEETLRACPYCAASEDFIHLLSCPSPRAMASRFKATIELKKALGDSAGNNSIFRAVKQWTLNPQANIQVPSCASGFQRDIDRAVHSQSAIGWPHLLRGLISAKWGLIVDSNDLSSSTTVPSPTTTHHLALAIRALQDYSLAIWTSRNDALHNNEELSRDILHAELHHDIQAMYAFRDTFSPILQSYFSLPIEARLLRPLRQKQRWLRLVRLATSHSTMRGSRQQVLSRYFPFSSVQDTASLAPRPTGPLPVLPSITQQVPITQYITPHSRAAAPSHD